MDCVGAGDDKEMRNSVKQATSEILELCSTRFEDPLNDDEQDWFENELYKILDEFFPESQNVVNFTPSFDGSTPVPNSTLKENPSVRYQEKERSSTNVSRSERRSNYTPRRGGDVRSENK